MNVPLSSTYNNPTARYIRWFGAADAKRIGNVKDAWTTLDNALHNANLSFTAHKPQYFAYANGSSMDYYGSSIWGSRSLFSIRLGDDFWSAPLTGEDSQAGTIVHELTHMYLRTGDHKRVSPRIFAFIHVFNFRWRP
jgi:peptidyl-Lys metalloendopeptidase